MSGSIAVLDDLEQVASVLGVELRQAPVVDDEDLGFGDGGEELGIASVGACDGQFAQQPRQAPVRGAVSIAARAMGQRTSEPGLSHAGRTGDEAVEVLADPASIGERQDEVLVQSSRLSEVDVFDARGVAKLRAAQPVGELSGVSLGDFSVDEEPESFLERQILDLG